ncbi:phosphatidylglycerol lysyltransferase domain-containing protein [Algirhabdus cladophorae]|uniref:phosphatidylglycerol lysyltransferase domain-containing protein n=1 Tax=Algirhabdus cladophorae TaxID=3377108 RepID=UPI003B8487F0
MKAARLIINRGWALARPALILAGFFVVMAILGRKVSDVDWPDVFGAIAALPVHVWITASFTTLISFLALGRYDVLVHRMLGTPASAKTAMTSGMCGIALGQVLGFGMVTGAIVRWRMLPGLKFTKVAAVAGLAGVSFLAAWAVLVGIVLIVSPLSQAPNLGFWILGACTAGFAVYIAASLRLPPAVAAKLPSLSVCGAFLFWALIDTAAAAATLYVLLPAGVEISWTMVFAAYLIALGAGLISNTPGGVGAFELALLTLLPSIGAEPLLAAIFAFRIIYYAVPAIVAVILLAKPPRPIWHNDVSTLERHPHLVTTLTAQTVQAEAGLIHQGQLNYLSHSQTPRRAKWLAATLAHHTVAIGKPLDPEAVGAIDLLEKTAQLRHKSPVFYKANGRLAAKLRRRGYVCRAISAEAVITPQSFAIEGSQHRQLRRLLRKADEVTTKVLPPYGDLPVAQMQDVARTWSSAKPEFGLSMGRFCPNYLAAQQIALAYQGDKFLGFVSFHSAAHEWTLDLVRVLPDAPAGTAHKLVIAALEQAKTAGITRLSLAAAPLAARHATGPLDRLVQRFENPGLRRFKSSFNPKWEPQYLAAQSRFQLVLAGFCLWHQITKPASLPKPSAAKNQSATHNQDENYEFALIKQS